MKISLFKKIVKKMYILIVPIMIVGVVLFSKPSIRNIVVKSSKYKTPANSSFTDINFYKCVVRTYNSANNTDFDYTTTNLTDEQLASIETLLCSDQKKSDDEKIKNIVGIEKLTNLQSLYLYDTGVSSLDLSFNPNIVLVNLVSNAISSINLSQNQLLESLYLDRNMLTELDLSDNNKLKSIYIYEENLTNLSFDNKDTLEKLTLSSTKVANLDLSGYSVLKNLKLDYNGFTSIDLRNCTSLWDLYLYDKLLSDIKLDGVTTLHSVNLYSDVLTTLDLSHNKELRSFHFFGTGLTSIDLKENTKLTTIDLYAPSITNIDLSHNTDLTGFYYGFYDSVNHVCNNSALLKLDLSHNNLLEDLQLDCTDIKELNLSHNQSLENLTLTAVPINNLDLSNNLLLYKLELNDVPITSLDLSQNTNLSKFYVSGGQLTSLNLSYNQLLSEYSIDDQSKTYVIINNDLSDIIEPELKNIIDSNNIKNSYTIEYDYIDVDGSIGKFNFKYKIKKADFSSNKYDIGNNYIITGTDTQDTILQNISLSELQGVEGVIEDDKYIVKYKGNVVKEYDLINYSSSKYDLSGNSVNVADNTIQSFLNNITCTNCNAYIYDGTKKITSGLFRDGYTLKIEYNNQLLKEYSLNYLVTGITLDINEIKLNTNNVNSYQLSYEITPVNAGNKNVIWESSNPNVAVVNNGYVTAVGYGNATITVKTVDGEFTDTCDVVVDDFPEYTVTYRWNDGEEKSVQVQSIEGENIIKKFMAVIYTPGKKIIGWKYNSHIYVIGSEELAMPNHDIELVGEFGNIFFDISDYSIQTNGEKKYIYGIGLNINVNNLDKLGLDSYYRVGIYESDGYTLKTSGNVGTGDIVKIFVQNYGDYLIDTGIVIINGDNNGDGIVDVSDVSNVYKHIKGKLDFDYSRLKSSNVNGDLLIDVSDVSNMYKYIKGKIDNI